MRVQQSTVIISCLAPLIDESKQVQPSKETQVNGNDLDNQQTIDRIC
jgi:hypothetical protein